jgi:outer membrane biosynthesis protein TonB
MRAALRAQEAVMPIVHPTELEALETHDSVLEVIVLWGDQSVLHVAHLSPPRSFCVGDALDARGKPATDFVIGSESLGTACLPLTCEGAQGPALVVPKGATLELMQGDRCLSHHELSAQGAFSSCDALPGALQCPLPAFASARLCYRGFTFVVMRTTAAKPVGVGGLPGIDWQHSRFTLGSVALHAAVLLLFYFLPPRSSALALDQLHVDSRLVSYALDTPEVSDEPAPAWSLGRDDAQASDGQRAKEDEGQSGDPKAKKTHGKLGVPGPADNRKPELPREAQTQLAQTAGIIGVLRASVGAWNTPTSPFSSASARGSDPVAALGALLGNAIANNRGSDGLAMIGPGRGGGGPAAGTIGIGVLGTIVQGAHGGDGSRYGQGGGGLHGHHGEPPHHRKVKIDVRGALSKEVIRRIIHRHLEEIRYCYEQALQSRPELQGRVAVRFIVAPTGAVQAAAKSSSDLGNPRLEQCIVDSVARWTFPAPDGGGLVVVTYPFVLQQTGD